MADLPKLGKSDKAAADHATDFDPPIYNVWKQQEKTIKDFCAPGRNLFDGRPDKHDNDRRYEDTTLQSITVYNCPSANSLPSGCVFIAPEGSLFLGGHIMAPVTTQEHVVNSKPAPEETVSVALVVEVEALDPEGEDITREFLAELTPCPLCGQQPEIAQIDYTVWVVRCKCGVTFNPAEEQVSGAMKRAAAARTVELWNQRE